ncbi:MAG: inositol monophosphatase [Thermoleophilia bacterium]|nr:inositol monophosphatase [Thermoleophilia bacterium]
MSNAAASETFAARIVAIEAMAREAGALLKSRFGTPGTITSKGVAHDSERVFDVVTEVDFAAEKLVLSRIAETAPDAYVVAEEGGLTRVDGTRVDPADEPDFDEVEDLWLVDPLDGTVNFASSLPLFCVSIAWYSYGKPVAGAIFAPMLDELYLFKTGNGATLNGVPLRIDPDVPAKDTVLASGGVGFTIDGHTATPEQFKAIIRNFRSWRRVGSAALALAWTAAGRFGGYAQFGSLNPWDYAVGAQLVLEAGGEIVNHELEPWTNPLTGQSGIVCGGRAVQATLIGAISS